jgi:glycosyltransferase involved in cell wall biosynthesis
VDFAGIKRDRRAKRTDKLIITNCGTLEDRKNQILLLDVAQQLLQARYSNFEIWLIGTGRNANLYQELIVERGLQEHVKLLGWQEKPWRAISESHLYLHTALNEAFGYAVVEAIAAGTFAMGVDVGGLSEVLEADSLVPAEEAKSRFVATILSYNFDEIAARTKHQYEITGRKFDIAVWGEKHACLYQ